jgi:hypothetical protein
MTENEIVEVKNAISLAISCTNGGWALVEPAAANLLLVRVNSETDLQTLQNLQQKFPDERLVVFASNEFAIEARWLLPFIKRNVVPTILSIVNLFSRIHAHFLPSENRLGPPEFYDPYEDLLGIVQESINDGMARICSCAGGPELYLLPNEHAFYLSGNIEQLIPMVLAKRQAIQSVTVNDHQVIEAVSYVKFSSRLSSYLTLDDDNLFQAIKVKKYKRYALNELLWFAVLIGSRGRFLVSSQWEETILLKQLPEYLRLDYYGKEYKPLADHINAHSDSLAKIATSSTYPVFQIIGFYNACSVMHLIESGDAARQLIKANADARKVLEKHFTPIGQSLKGRIKIVVSGSVGSGKTAAIATLSDFSPISSETRPSDSVTRKKSTTTVAMDYGEIRFNENLKIFLYGTPGQRRFDFMSKLLCDNAWGMLLLIDNSDQNPLGELAYYLDLFDGFLTKIQLVIGITHYDMTASPTLSDYDDFLAARHLSFPLMPADARTMGGLVPLLSRLANQSVLEAA